MSIGKKLLMIGIVTIIVGAVYAEEAQIQASAKQHENNADWMNAFHNPMEGLEMGLDLRLREVYNKNMSVGDAPFNNDNHWQRYRLRLSAKYAIDEDIDFNARYVWEFWNWCYPESTSRGMDWRQSFFDGFNFQFRNVFDMPATLTVGRQDIILGAGWLVVEGTPSDGSRSIFFDAARLRYDLSETSTLDLVYILQYDDLDQWLPRFDHMSPTGSFSGQHITDWQDEQGFIAYYTNKARENLSYDAYFIYKNEEQSDFAKSNVPSKGYDAEIYTLGTRLFGKMNDNWSYSAEFAGQWGDRDGADLCAFGTNNKLTYSFNDENKNQLFCGYEYMSGDNPNTSKDERFDGLWSGYPQPQRGGDLQVYMWTPEYGNIAEIGNLHRFGVGHAFKPADAWTMVSQYNLLWADQDVNSSTNTVGSFTSSGSSRFRGHLLSCVATYQPSEKFKTHFMVDYLFPGDYYPNAGGEDAFFSRINVEWTF